MTSINKVKDSDSFLVLSFLFFGSAPLLFKLVAGSIGPTFNFYFFLVWIPALTISLAMLRGWKECSMASVLMVSAILVSLITYPMDPPMDFRRQLVHQANIHIMGAALGSISLLIALRRRRFKGSL